MKIHKFENDIVPKGTVLKVERKVKSDKNGWYNSWENEYMDIFIGKDATVIKDVKIDNDTGIDLTRNDAEYSFEFPAFALTYEGKRIANDNIYNKKKEK